MTEPDVALEPGGRNPAPGELELVQRFVNTVDIEAGAEKLLRPEDLREWLAGRGLLSARAPVSPHDLTKAITLREALRAMLAHNNGEPLDRGALPALERVAAGARLSLRFSAGPPSIEPRAPGVDGALGRIVALVFRSMSDGSWDRLKICRSHSCQWAFYDWSKNHSGEWCTMAICGNREKVRSYRLRARSEGGHGRSEARRARSEARSSR